jgi:hypothetical protein
MSDKHWPLFLSFMLYDKDEHYAGDLDLNLWYETEAEMKVAFEKYQKQIGSEPDLSFVRDFILVEAIPAQSPFNNIEDLRNNEDDKLST